MAKIYNIPGIGNVNSGTQFVLNGFQYPNNWLELATPADLSSRNITVTEVPDPPPSIDDVVVERNRRLALGFEYDFEDERGIHVIGTTEDDMKGWDEVSKASSAFISIGQPDAELNIVTNTGSVTVTALEFQNILVAAALARQPLWAASFALQDMNPIPDDYTSDSYWS